MRVETELCRVNEPPCEIFMQIAVVLGTYNTETLRFVLQINSDFLPRPGEPERNVIESECG